MTNKFKLDSRLDGSTELVVDLSLCQVRLMNDRAVPWLLLIPRKPDLVELKDLSKPDRAHLMEEIVLAESVLERLYRPEKLNVGALGNMVNQLHIHIIARFRLDRAWPNAIWNTGPIITYSDDEMQQIVTDLKEQFTR